MARFNELLRRHASEAIRNTVTVDIADQSVTLYAKPLTGHDLDRIMARHKNFATAPTLSAVVDLLIMKVEDESGDPAFDAADKPFLLKMPVDWVNRVRSGLFPEQDADLSDEAIDAAVGN
jgi:ribosomal protein L12E/L44/L45/RPP1/RPP2